LVPNAVPQTVQVSVLQCVHVTTKIFKVYIYQAVLQVIQFVIKLVFLTLVVCIFQLLFCVAAAIGIVGVIAFQLPITEATSLVSITTKHSPDTIAKSVFTQAI
jgi:hypothetical protein